MTMADWVGSTGVIILLAAFFLNLIKKLRTDSFLYTGMNFTGAAISCAASCLLHYVPFIVLEGIWALVSLTALVRQFGKTPSRS